MSELTHDPFDTREQPQAPIPAPRDEAREFATFLPFTADRLQAAKEALLDAQKCCDECHQSVSAAIAPYMAAATRADAEMTEDLHRRAYALAMTGKVSAAFQLVASESSETSHRALAEIANLAHLARKSPGTVRQCFEQIERIAAARAPRRE